MGGPVCVRTASGHLTNGQMAIACNWLAMLLFVAPLSKPDGSVTYSDQQLSFTEGSRRLCYMGRCRWSRLVCLKAHPDISLTL